MPHDLRTQGIVLRRTNYGESDRILNIITPEGKYAVLARGVRKEKSRLAGGIELFTVADVVIHQGRSELGTLTSAKMLRFYGNIMTDLAKVELASEALRKIERASEQTDNPDFFSILEQVLAELNKSTDPSIIKFWFDLQMLQAVGEEINLIRDVDGNVLEKDSRYFWDSTEQALRAHPQGNITAPAIKLARLCLTSKLSLISRVQAVEQMLTVLTPIAKR